MITEQRLIELTGFKPPNSHFHTDGESATFACNYTAREFGNHYSVWGIWYREDGYKTYSRNCATWCEDCGRHKIPSPEEVHPDLPTHKLLALLMHQFEIESFEVTCGDVEAFRREYGGELPVVTFQDFGDRLQVRLMSKTDAKRLRQ